MAHLTRTLAAVLTLGLAAPAYAGPQPPTPPSGIVVHLFGPNSLTSHILPTAPEPSPTGPQATGTPVNSTAPAASSPSWGDIAHQMFVTGNPSQEGAAALPKGRAGQ